MDMYLAELNIGRLVAPTDDPCVADFMAALDRINGLGKWMQGFVCCTKPAPVRQQRQRDRKLNYRAIFRRR